MKRIWWTWDLRMRWAHGFSANAESYLANYRAAIDAAPRHGVEGIVEIRDSYRFPKSHKSPGNREILEIGNCP
jgi:hypothetical protein